MNEFLILLVGLIVILIVLYFMFGKEWGAMVRNFLPTVNTTTNNDYSTISGTDEVLYDLPSGLPSFDFNKPAVDSCPYYTVKYTEGIFSIFNSSGNRIGALKKREIPVDSWNLYDLTGLIKIIQRQKLDGSSVLNDINYYGVKSDSAIHFFFDGEKIVCGGSPSTSSTVEVKKDIEYYVSNTDCYGWGKKYCVKYFGNGEEIDTDFYFPVSSFEKGKSYDLYVLLNGRDQKLCSISIGNKIDSICDSKISYHDGNIQISGKYLVLKNGKYVFNQTI